MLKKIWFLILGVLYVILSSYASAMLVIGISLFFDFDFNNLMSIFLALLSVSLMVSILVCWKRHRPQFYWWLVGALFVFLIITNKCYETYEKFFLDNGKICNDSSECLGYCLAELSDEEKQMYENSEDFITSGSCTPHDTYFGCFPFVRNGNVSSKECPPGTIAY